MFNFREGESAEAKCSNLHTALHYAAAKLDIVIPLHATDEDKAIMVDSDMKIFAEKMHDQGWVLHVLLDEMQATVLASLPSDALLFVSTIKRIKRIVQKVSPFDRVACTGSAVLTLLS
jgi:deoxyribose-phosphate aldolase